MTRSKEPRIVDPATHPRKWVSITVAAVFLEVDRGTLSGWLDEGKIPYEVYGRRRRIRTLDLVAVQREARRRAS